MISEKQLKQEVYVELGGSSDPDELENSPLVQVELSEEAFCVVMREATRWFNAKKGLTKYVPVTIVDGVTDYKMPSCVNQVLDVYFSLPSDVASFFTLGFFDVIPFGAQPTMGSAATTSNYSSFAQILEFNEKRKRVFSVDPDWWYEPQTNTLYLIVRKGISAGSAAVKVKTTDWKIEDLKDKDELIFSRYVKAKCKKIVGRVRSKYDSYPTAGGATSLDGKDLIAEANEELIQLDIDIFASQGVDECVIG
jgi:hypothetical protein